MNNVIKYWDENLASCHIGNEINWIHSYLETNKIDRISYIDIGGNVGKFFDELSKKYIVEKCIIVEPSKKLCEYMSNKFKNNFQIDVHNFGISKENGLFEFDDSGIDYWSDGDIDNSINLGIFKMQNNPGNIQFYTMDYFMDNFNTIEPEKITFIKIDTENRDLFIIKDLSSYLLKNNIKPLILFENNYHNDMSREDAEKIVNDFCNFCEYEKVDLSISGDMHLIPIKQKTLKDAPILDKNSLGVKMPIGEITDRYSIALLKNERANADNIDEINFLNNELIKYEGISEYIHKLKEINGKIWDLESDIRKGKEEELGLEEIGRRALKIRDFNKVRVGYKNEMVKKYGEGFEDIKINHGSAQNKVVITLTTVPERLNQNEEDGLKLVIKSLCTQNYSNYEVHFNIPFKYNITGEEYIIPSWLHNMEQNFKHLKIFRVDDMGPPTKVVPTIIRENNETLLLVVDDDLVYDADMINEHVKYHEKLPNSVVLYDGRSLINPKYGDLRDSWVLTVKEILQVKELQHYKSASYFKKYFDDDFFNDFLGKTKSDDVLMSFYFAFKNIPLHVVPYKPEMVNINTYDEWYKFQGVTTFPVIRHSNSIIQTGCNHPDMIKNEPRFFIPEEFKTIDFMLNKNKDSKSVIKPSNYIKNKIDSSIKDRIQEIIEEFKNIPKKYWDKLNMTGDECTFERSKGAPYLKAAMEIANLLNMKTVVEIGSTRYGITQKCVDYFYGDSDYFVSPPCCSDGHGGIFWTLEGFNVHSVDIDINCKTNCIWSFEVFNLEVPNNLHLHIPKDGIEFLTEFSEKIDVLFLDGWDVGTHEYKEKHLESFEIAKNKLSDIHLILIDDTDYVLENEGKDALLTPVLMSLGYTLIFEGRQKLFINKKINDL